MTYDARRQLIVHFDGSATWEYDGAQWVERQLYQRLGFAALARRTMALPL